MTLSRATWAGVECSECKKRINMFIKTVMFERADTDNAIPFHDDESDEHWRNFKVPKISKHDHKRLPANKGSVVCIQLGLRSKKLDDESLGLFCMVLWALWYARNMYIYEQRVVSCGNVLALAYGACAEFGGANSSQDVQDRESGNIKPRWKRLWREE
ncbi:conserved hypothetical protein [Ricinus communis]|uniref:Uncharacterized protein n=1 Tax=Ricinus communis TaxID=3988 RepID=B9SL62_RICCO|nr:conserved hypothetical protein [Ricinus communis]